jgi:hypothetical protein
VFAVNAVEEARFVESVLAYSAAMKALVIVEDDAENSVVDAFAMTARVMVEVPVVLVFTNDAPIAERLVVEALVVDAFVP